MKTPIMLKIILGICGLVAMAIATKILFSPECFYAANHINLHHNVNLLSEIRAPATALFVYGLVIFLGVFITQLTLTSTLLSTLLYFSYGIGRILSMVLDGQPIDNLVVAAGIEILLGIVSLVCLVKYVNANQKIDFNSNNIS